MFLKRADPYDAIVMSGSGRAGAMSARELTLAGARVLLLESRARGVTERSRAQLAIRLS